MRLTFILLGLLVVLLWAGILWWLKRKLHLSFSSNNSGFLQAWIYLLQTAALLVTLFYVGVQTANVGTQTALLQETIRINTAQQIASAQRELLSKALERPELFDAIAGKSRPQDFAATDIYLSMFFNHGFNAFTLRQHCFIDDDWWAAMVSDMKDLMRRERMRERWAATRQFYPTRYQNFVDRSVLGDEKETKRCGD